MIAPDLDLFGAPAAPAVAVCVPPPPEVRAQLAKLRDEMQALASRGRFQNAASREWDGLPSEWRMALLLVGGVGEESGDMDELARRSWDRIPPPERDAVRRGVRSARRHIGRLRAMAAQD